VIGYRRQLPDPFKPDSRQSLMFAGLDQIVERAEAQRIDDPLTAINARHDNCGYVGIVADDLRSSSTPLIPGICTSEIIGANC
jgi:hypothetical protein